MIAAPAPDPQWMLRQLTQALDETEDRQDPLRMIACRVTSRSTLYTVGRSSSYSRYIVKVPVLDHAASDTDPAMSASEQFAALQRAYEWFQQEDAHSVARPVALLEECGALVMERLPGASLVDVVKRSLIAPARARAAVGAAGDALRRLHHHARRPDASVDLEQLADEVRAADQRYLRPAGVRLPDSVLHVLDAMPAGRVPCSQVLLHGDYVPSNLIPTAAAQVGMIDPVLSRVGLPADDLARFLAVLASHTIFVPGLLVPPVRRFRRDLEEAFRHGYGPSGSEPLVLELRLLLQHVLRWRRRRDLSRLSGHEQLMRWRQAVIDRHMRSLLAESAERASCVLAGRSDA